MVSRQGPRRGLRLVGRADGPCPPRWRSRATRANGAVKLSIDVTGGSGEEWFTPPTSLDLHLWDSIHCTPVDKHAGATGTCIVSGGPGGSGQRTVGVEAYEHPDNGLSLRFVGIEESVQRLIDEQVGG